MAAPASPRIHNVLLIVVLGLSPSWILAAVTQIQTTPNPPLVVGNGIDYKVVSNAAVVTSYSIQSRCLEPNAVGNWTPDPVWTQASNVFGFISDRVGNREFKGGAFETIGMNPPAWAYLTKNVTIVGPDNDVIVDGLNVNSAGWETMKREVHYEVRSGTIKVGQQIAGYPQERIRRPQNNPPYDSGWNGPAANEFYWQGDYINDVKTAYVLFLDQQNWNAMAIGAIMDDFFQQNRFVIENCTGIDEVVYTFVERHFQKVKSGAQTFKLIEITP